MGWPTRPRHIELFLPARVVVAGPGCLATDVEGLSDGGPGDVDFTGLLDEVLDRFPILGGGGRAGRCGEPLAEALGGCSLLRDAELGARSRCHRRPPVVDLAGRKLGLRVTAGKSCSSRRLLP